jgi:hypothetical protein
MLRGQLRVPAVAADAFCIAARASGLRHEIDWAQVVNSLASSTRDERRDTIRAAPDGKEHLT